MYTEGTPDYDALAMAQSMRKPNQAVKKNDLIKVTSRLESDIKSLREKMEELQAMVSDMTERLGKLDGKSEVKNVDDSKPKTDKTDSDEAGPGKEKKESRKKEK